MAISNFQPEIWSAQVLSVLAKELVFAGAPCVNTQYEGDIRSSGDTVRVTNITDPNIFAYTKDSDLTAVQALTDAQQLLLIDQSWAFNFQVDDIDAAQVASAGAVLSEAAARAAFGLRDKADTYVAGKIAGGAMNGVGVVDASSTATNVYDLLLVQAAIKLDEANVPSQGRFMVVSPATYGKLLLDSRFIKANEAGTSAGLRNGVVGEAAGFTILKSNNMPTRARSGLTATTTNANPTLTASPAGTWSAADIGLAVTGTGVGASAKVVSVTADGTSATLDVNSSASATISNVAVVANGIVALGGSSIATTFAQQIAKVEAYRPQARFADALKGLHLFGAKVLRPTALVAGSVKLS